MKPIMTILCVALILLSVNTLALTANQVSIFTDDAIESIMLNSINYTGIKHSGGRMIFKFSVNKLQFVNNNYDFTKTRINTQITYADINKCAQVYDARRCYAEVINGNTPLEILDGYTQIDDGDFIVNKPIMYTIYPIKWQLTRQVSQAYADSTQVRDAAAATVMIDNFVQQGVPDTNIQLHEL
jgi:hypothetical protein